MPATTEIPNLWPVDHIRVDTLSPATILRVQATEIGRLSQGVLRGEVLRQETGSAVILALDVFAPAAGNLRRRVVTVTHSKEAAYPANIMEMNDPDDRLAASQQEFLAKLQGILQSPQTVSVIQSLLARTNEQATESSAPQNNSAA